jgi:hypothetical protein
VSSSPGDAPSGPPAATLLVRWVTGDVTHVRAILGAALGIASTPEASIAIPGLRLEVADSRTGPGTRVADHLEVATADPTGEGGPADTATAGVARLFALGWATVDLDRAAAASPGVRWTVVPRDSLLGARGLLGDPAATAGGGEVPGPDVALLLLEPDPVGEVVPAWRPGSRLLLLEPDTEGRIAAALARHGEGPAALYVALPAAAIAGARRRLAALGVRPVRGAGPFGPEMAPAGPPASGPTLILLRLPGPVTAGGPAEGGRGTIPP